MDSDREVCGLSASPALVNKDVKWVVGKLIIDHLRDCFNLQGYAGAVLPVGDNTTRKGQGVESKASTHHRCIISIRFRCEVESIENITTVL